MTRIVREASERTPFVDFDFDSGQLTMSGESYPENAAAFFGPLIQALQEYLSQSGRRNLTFNLKMLYFNSSSAKALMNLFQLMENEAQNGSLIVINWYYHQNDDIMEEFGEDFSEDFIAARFEMQAIPNGLP